MNKKLDRKNGRGQDLSEGRLSALKPAAVSVAITAALYVALSAIMALIAAKLDNPSAFLLPAGIAVAFLSAAGCGIVSAFTAKELAALVGIIAEVVIVILSILLRFIFGRGCESVAFPTDALLYLSMVGLSFLGTVIGAGLADVRKKRRRKLKH